MRTLSATVVLKEGLAWYIRCRTSAAAHRESDLQARREAAEKAPLDLLSVCVA